MSQKLQFYCGCCGGAVPDTEVFCAKCKPHLGKDERPERRTYWAQHGEQCPFDTGVTQEGE